MNNKERKELAKKARDAQAAANEAFDKADALALAADAAYVEGHAKYEIAKDAFEVVSLAFTKEECS